MRKLIISAVVVIAIVVIVIFATNGEMGRGKLYNKKLARSDGKRIINQSIDRVGSKGSTRYVVTFDFEDGTSYKGNCTGSESHLTFAKIWVDNSEVALQRAEALTAHAEAVLENEERAKKRAK